MGEHLTFALSLGWTQGDRGFSIRIYAATDTGTWTHTVSPATITDSSDMEAMLHNQRPDLMNGGRPLVQDIAKGGKGQRTKKRLGYITDGGHD